MKNWLVFVAIAFAVFAGVCSAQIQFATAVGGTDIDVGEAVVQTSDGGYLATGYTYSFGSDLCNMLLVKFNSTGYVEWTRVFGNEYLAVGSDCVQTQDGGYVIVSGYSVPLSLIWLVKLSPSFSVEWARRIYDHSMYFDFCRSLIQSTDGGYVMVGETNWYEDGDSVDF